MRRLIFATLLLTLTSCESEEKQIDSTPPAFQMQDKVIRNRRGDALLLRGMNVRVKQLFDAEFDNGRVPNIHVADFTAEDARLMRNYGFNFLRLAINWSALEPEKGQINQSAMDKINDVVRLCEAEGIYVLLDFHQDGYSKFIGQDGFPLWTIRPPLADPKKPSEDTHTSAASMIAFGHFIKNVDGLQNAFANIVAVVDAAFKNDPAVIGIEILNEPIAGTGYEQLVPFYSRVVKRVNGQNPDRIWFFEPSAVRNQTDKTPLAVAPFPSPNAVYSPHIYTNVFSGASASLEDSMANAHNEAESWNAPLFVGEFGAGPGEWANQWLRRSLDLQNKYLAHSTLWVWKEYESWGIFEATGTVTDTVWKLRPEHLKNMSSPYPQEVEGTLISLAFDRAKPEATAEVELKGSGRILWGVPPAWFPKGATGYCDSTAAAAPIATSGRLEFTCPVATSVVRIAGN